MINAILFISLLLTPCYSLPLGVTTDGFDPAALYQEIQPLTEKLSAISGIPQHQVLYEIFGELHFEHIRTESINYNCFSTLKCYGDHDILGDPMAHGLLIHELGHRFLNNTGKPFTDFAYSLGYYENGAYVHVSGINPVTNKFERTPLGYPEQGQPYEMHGCISPDYHSFKEDIADMFMGWALGNFTDDQAGRLREAFITQFILDNLPLTHGKTNIERNSHGYTKIDY